MASLVCPECGSQVQWSDSGCASCGVPFRDVRCVSCQFTGPVERFPKRVCPRCSKAAMVIVPGEGAAAEQVGSEAFVEDVPLADEIERSFARTTREAKKRPAPDQTEPRPRDSRAEKRRDQTQREAARREDKRRDERAAPPPDDRDEERPAQPEAPRPREVLKRTTWAKPTDESDDAEAEPPPPKEPVAKSEPPPEKTRRRVRFELNLSPKARLILRWSAMGVPALAVLILAAYLLGGSGGSSRPRREPSEPTAQVDPAVMEQEAARLYQAAVDSYRSRQLEQAISTLQELVGRYPLTKAGRQAREALARMERGEPLFPIGAEAPAEPRPPTQPAATADATGARKKPVIGIPSRPRSGEAAPEAPESNLIVGTAPAPPGAPHQGSTLERAKNVSPRKLPVGFNPVDEAGVHSSGWPIEILCLADQSHMMLVPAGEFAMGSSDGEAQTRPQHRVSLRAFYIDRHEITLEQYQHFLAEREREGTPYRGLSSAVSSVATSAKHPVVGVAWRDASAYARWAGKELPTEGQWEKAARGDDARPHPWGTGEPVWGRPRQPKEIDPVGSFAWDVSVYGCYDMAGNAWEWCADWYDPNYYATSPPDNPPGPARWLPPVKYLDPERALRGGSPNWLITWREPGGIGEEPLHVGFRCVLDVERPEEPKATAAAAPATPKRDSLPPPPPGGFRF